MDTELSQKDKFITFKSGEEFFGLKIEYVSEIIVYQEFTEIPESADYIMGLINLRGKIIPVIDVRIRFRQEPFPYNDRTVIIVLNINDMLVGLIVEKIAEVVEITEDNIIPSPSISKNENSENKFVYAIGKVDDEVKLLLDPMRLIGEAEAATKDKSSDEDDEEGEE